MEKKYTRRDFIIGVVVSVTTLSQSPLESLADGETKKSGRENQNSEYKTIDFSKDTEQILLARMLFGEARDCSKLEKITIAYTAINRAKDGKKWNGETLREAILKPCQYSCFNKGDPNKEKLMDPEKYDKKSFQECLAVAEKVLCGEYEKFNAGATHYFNPKTVRKPEWADKMSKIGRIKISNNQYSKHEFYKEN